MKKKLHETTVALDSLGCKLNQAEMEILARQLMEEGYRLVSPSEAADIYILNTCTVTHVADRKTRQKLRGYHRKNPKAAVVAIGCYSERAPGELQKLAGVDLVIGNDDKSDILQILENSGYIGKGAETRSSNLYENSRRTRTFIKVQEGCRLACSLTNIQQIFYAGLQTGLSVRPGEPYSECPADDEKDKEFEMILSRDAYRELEDILGPENVSEDLAILDAYAFIGFGVGVGVGGWRGADRYAMRPEAVVLPGSTKEVQAIMKLCNRRGAKSKASSTGYGVFNTIGSEGAIQLDMRRMNRILDIDEKNMFILVEPYVSFAQVQAEVHKMGLNCHVIGAGSNCSYLASHTACGGTNTQAPYFASGVGGGATTSAACVAAGCVETLESCPKASAPVTTLANTLNTASSRTSPPRLGLPTLPNPGFVTRAMTAEPYWPPSHASTDHQSPPATGSLPARA